MAKERQEDDEALAGAEGRSRQGLRRTARAFGAISGIPGLIFLLSMPGWNPAGSPLVWVAFLIGIPCQFIPLGWALEALGKLAIMAGAYAFGTNADRLDVTIDFIAAWMPTEGANNYKSEQAASAMEWSERPDAQRNLRRSLRRGARKSILYHWRQQPGVSRLAALGSRRLSWIGALLAALAGFSVALLKLDPTANLTAVLSLQVSVISAVVSVLAFLRSRR